MAAPTRTTKSIENYTGEGPKWRLGELFHTSRATILIVMQSMHRMVWPDANKPPAGARGPRSRRASCVSAPTRFSNERIGGTWHGVTGESQIRPPSRLHIPSRNSCAKTCISRWVIFLELSHCSHFRHRHGPRKADTNAGVAQPSSKSKASRASLRMIPSRQLGTID
jgi:hypothetical protein